MNPASLSSRKRILRSDARSVRGVFDFSIAQQRFPGLRLVKSYKPAVTGPINIADKQGNAELLAEMKAAPLSG